MLNRLHFGVIRVQVANCQKFFAMCNLFLTTPTSNDSLFCCLFLLLVFLWSFTVSKCY